MRVRLARLLHALSARRVQRTPYQEQRRVRRAILAIFQGLGRLCARLVLLAPLLLYRHPPLVHHAKQGNIIRPRRPSRVLFATLVTALWVPVLPAALPAK